MDSDSSIFNCDFLNEFEDLEEPPCQSPDPSQPTNAQQYSEYDDFLLNFNYFDDIGTSPPKTPPDISMDKISIPPSVFSDCMEDDDTNDHLIRLSNAYNTISHTNYPRTDTTISVPKGGVFERISNENVPSFSLTKEASTKKDNEVVAGNPLSHVGEAPHVVDLTVEPSYPSSETVLGDNLPGMYNEHLLFPAKYPIDQSASALPSNFQSSNFDNCSVNYGKIIQWPFNSHGNGEIGSNFCTDVFGGRKRKRFTASSIPSDLFDLSYPRGGKRTPGRVNKFKPTCGRYYRVPIRLLEENKLTNDGPDQTSPDNFQKSFADYVRSRDQLVHTRKFQPILPANAQPAGNIQKSGIWGVCDGTNGLLKLTTKMPQME